MIQILCLGLWIFDFGFWMVAAHTTIQNPKSTIRRGGGGKIPFEKDFEAGLKKSKEEGKPVLLYFWADWSKYCTELDAGAFSDEEVVKAAEGFVPVIVDTSKDAGKIRAKYRVRFAPTVLILDSSGKVLDEHKDTWEKDRVLATLKLMARRHGRAFWCESPAKALELGKKEKRPVIVVTPVKDAKAEEIEKSLREALGDLAWKFLYAMAPAAEEAGLVLLDPNVEKPEDKPLAKLPADTKPDELKKKLEEAYKSWKKP